MSDFLRVSAGRHNLPYQYRDQMTLILLLNGEADGILNNETSILKAGDVWLVNRGVIYSLEHCSEDAVWLQIGLDMAAFDAYLPNISTVYFKMGPADDKEAMQDLKEEIRGRMCAIASMLGNALHGSLPRQELLYACLEILNDLRLGFQLVTDYAAEGLDADNYARVCRIVDYIYDHCNRKLTVKEVADIEYFSEGTLSKLLKSTTGYNFSDLLSLIRAECSIRYLLESDLSLTDIAYECGFSAPRYYNAAFEKFFHCSPREYQEKIRSRTQPVPESGRDAFVLQDGITREELAQLLTQYRADTYLPWEAICVCIDLDGLEPAEKENDIPHRREILCCGTEELISLRSLDCIRKCRDELRIKRISLRDAGESAFLKAALENVAYLGLSAVDSHSIHGVLELTGLFDAQGIETPLFYTQKIFNAVGRQYTFLKENVLLYRTDASDNRLRLLLFNDSARKEKKFSLSFAGEKAEAGYAVRITSYENRFKDWAPLQETALKETALDNDLLRELRRPVVTTGFVADLSEYRPEFIVDRKEAKLIEIIPLK